LTAGTGAKYRDACQPDRQVRSVKTSDAELFAAQCETISPRAFCVTAVTRRLGIAAKCNL
jgi:hypothetical protein